MPYGTPGLYQTSIDPALFLQASLPTSYEIEVELVGGFAAFAGEHEGGNAGHTPTAYVPQDRACRRETWAHGRIDTHVDEIACKKAR